MGDDLKEIFELGSAIFEQKDRMIKCHNLDMELTKEGYYKSARTQTHLLTFCSGFLEGVRHIREEIKRGNEIKMFGGSNGPSVDDIIH